MRSPSSLDACMVLPHARFVYFFKERTVRLVLRVQVQPIHFI